MLPSSNLPPLPPFGSEYDEYDCIDTIDIHEFEGEPILEKEFEGEGVLYDISEIFLRSFHQEIILPSCISRLSGVTDFRHCFIRPVEGNCAIYWDRDKRQERIQSIINSFIDPQTDEKVRQIFQKWLAPNLWRCGIPEIHFAASTQHFVPHMRHFEQLFMFYDDDPELVHFSRFHGNFVHLNDDGRERLFVSFFHKAIFYPAKKKGSFFAYVLLHRNLISMQMVPYLLQFQKEAEVTFNPYPPLSITLHQENFANTLEHALSAQLTSLENPQDTSHIPLQILDCTAGYLAQIQADPTHLSIDNLLEDFKLDVDRLSSFFLSADLSFPKEGEDKSEWLKRVLSPWIFLQQEQPSPLFGRVVTWFCQSSEANLLRVFQDPEQKKHINSCKQHLSSLIYLRTLPNQQLVSTILKTNFTLSIPDQQKKHQGYFSILRMAIFDQKTEKVRYNSCVIVHSKQLTPEEAEQFMLYRPEGLTKPVIFS